MIQRDRACAAILRGGQILMVLEGLSWTLPGGGLEAGETPEQAACREVLEECGLAVKILRLLFERDDFVGHESTFLAEIIGDENYLRGSDPEHPLDEVWMETVRWQPLAEMQADPQVQQVLIALQAGNG